MPTTQVKLGEAAWIEVATSAATQFTAQLTEGNAPGEAYFRFDASLPAPTVTGGLRLRSGQAIERRHGTGALYGRGVGTVTVTT